MTSAPEVAAVLFDLDGTLFDHGGAANAALRRWLPTVGLGADDSTVRAWFDAEERHVARWRSGRIGWAEQRRERLREVLGASRPAESTGVQPAEATEAQLDEVFAGYLREYESAWRAFDDVEPALRALHARGVRVAVLTNGASAQQRDKLHAVGLGGRFEFVLTAEDLGLGKPDPAVYAAACRRFGLPPSAVLHVGDVPDLDVTAPRAAGLRAVLLDRDGRHGQNDALRSLHALPALLSEP